MSTFRKTMLTTAIIGAGLASTTGSAFATEGHHDHRHDKGQERTTETPQRDGGCSNTAALQNENGAGSSEGLLGVLGGDQSVLGLNVCNILNNNSILNGTSVAVGGSDVRNGDNTTVRTASADGDGSVAGA